MKKAKCYMLTVVFLETRSGILILYEAEEKFCEEDLKTV